MLLVGRKKVIQSIYLFPPYFSTIFPKIWRRSLQKSRRGGRWGDGETRIMLFHQTEKTPPSLVMRTEAGFLFAVCASVSRAQHKCCRTVPCFATAHARASAAYYVGTACGVRRAWRKQIEVLRKGRPIRRCPIPRRRAGRCRSASSRNDPQTLCRRYAPT